MTSFKYKREAWDDFTASSFGEFATKKGKNGIPMGHLEYSNLEYDLVMTLLDIIGDNKTSEVDQLYETIKEMVGTRAGKICTVTSMDILSNEIQRYDTDTYIHSVRVSIISMIIGRIMGYERKTIEELGIAGLLHDIGKKFLPIEIVNKPAALSEIERSIIKSHSAMSVYYLKEKYPFINENILQGIYEHHERLDGSGYPRKLYGNQISEIGKVIAVADVLEAYSSKRSYHNKRTLKETIDFMSKQDGLDQHIIDCLKKSIDFQSGIILFEHMNH